VRNNDYVHWSIVGSSLLLILISFSLYAMPNELQLNEKNTIEIFQTFSPKVVYIHRLTRVRKYFSSDLMQHVTTGAGSGIIWDNKGHIVTNYHVTHGADELAVDIGKLTIPAKIVGVEPRKDIAVLAISDLNALKLLRSFTPFEIKHSNDLLVGQKAIAIGNPFGLDHSLTVGVISALGRQVPGFGGVRIQQMIQTDASINPGNSGGPLLDSSGHLIGLNTVIYSNSGASAGIGFAVPADEIERIVPQIITHGRVVLAGIGIQRVDISIASRLGVHKGILIADVIPHTPAAKVGLKGTYRDRYGNINLGDIIIALNAQSIEDYDKLYNLLTHVKVGETVTLTVNRHGRQLKFRIKTIDIAGL
jgi:S1-C subfamily serine protease